MDRELLFGIIPTPEPPEPLPCKSVFSPAVARKLLKLGHRVVDIKPDKSNRDRTIFLFEKTELLLQDLGALTGRSFVK